MLSDTVNVLEKDIEFGEQLWKTFESETFGEYHNIHLQSDVLVLADVFENFRELFKETYGLNTCHYYSEPNVSWDVMLKNTEVNLELLPDIDILLFCENAIRGGLTGIGEKRFKRANNK